MARIPDDARNYVMLFSYKGVEIHKIRRETNKSFITDEFYKRLHSKDRPHRVFARKRDAEKYKKLIEKAYNSTVINKTEAVKSKIKKLNGELAKIKGDLKRDIFDNLEDNYPEYLI